jgi:hypothetical protein
VGEYQYYEFRAIDRPLSDADQRELRTLSSRARITATSFTNHYDWGDFAGDPAKMMRRWFDLHVYMANWGSHRLMMRLPARLMEPGLADRFLRNIEDATLETAGDNLMLDISLGDLDHDYSDDGSRWLTRLAPLRADLLAGDLRIFYLLWLTAVQIGSVDPAEPEPLPGIGPMNAALKAFVDFAQIDDGLAYAAAERPTAITETKPDAPPRRTAGELLARATTVREARTRRQAARKGRALSKKLEPLRQRGEAAWHEVESGIELRNRAGYRIAIDLLLDLKTLAELDGTSADFSRRLDSIRERHSRKLGFIAHLDSLTGRR